MAVAMAGDMQDLKVTLVVNSNVFSADKGLVDPLWVAYHLSYPFASLRLNTETDSMIGNPLVIARSEEAIRVLDHQAILVAASEQHLTGDLFQGSVASVMVGIGVSINRQRQS